MDYSFDGKRSEYGNTPLRDVFVLLDACYYIMLDAIAAQGSGIRGSSTTVMVYEE